MLFLRWSFESGKFEFSPKLFLFTLSLSFLPQLTIHLTIHVSSFVLFCVMASITSCTFEGNQPLHLYLICYQVLWIIKLFSSVETLFISGINLVIDYIHCCLIAGLYTILFFETPNIFNLIYNNSSGNMKEYQFITFFYFSTGYYFAQNNVSNVIIEWMLYLFQLYLSPLWFAIQCFVTLVTFEVCYEIFRFFIFNIFPNLADISQQLIYAQS
jgi:hypothetical protein